MAITNAHEYLIRTYFICLLLVVFAKFVSESIEMVADKTRNVEEEIQNMKKEFLDIVKEKELSVNKGNKSQLFTLQDYESCMRETQQAQKKEPSDTLTCTDRRRLDKYSVIVVSVINRCC